MTSALSFELEAAVIGGHVFSPAMPEKFVGISCDQKPETFVATVVGVALDLRGSLGLILFETAVVTL